MGGHAFLSMKSRSVKSARTQNRESSLAAPAAAADTVVKCARCPGLIEAHVKPVVLKPVPVRSPGDRKKPFPVLPNPDVWEFVEPTVRFRNWRSKGSG